MSFGPQVVMPGAFHFEAAPNAGTSLSGVHPGMFRPPISPSTSSSYYLGRSTGSLYSDASTTTPISNAKRKRHRDRESTPLNTWTTPTTAATVDAGFRTDDAHGDRSEVAKWMDEGEGRYVLAGQIETPNGVSPTDIKDAMEDSIYSDIDYRRVLASKRPHTEIESPNFNHRPVAASPRGQSRQAKGWGSFALNTLGGVVGKVFQFCKAGVFRGFYAGGGVGYEMRTPPRRPLPSDGQVWCNEHDIPTLPSFDSDTAPAAFPQSDHSAYQYGRETPESTPPPAAKRRQLTEGVPGDELRRNWVMVQEPAEKTRSQSVSSRAPTRPASQQQSFSPIVRRRISRPISRANTRVSTTTSFNRSQSSRISHAGSTSLSHHEPASFASPRSRSPVASYTPSRIPVLSRPQSPNPFPPARLSQQPSFIPSPTAPPKRGHRRNHSTASAASVASSRVRRRDSVPDFDDNSPRLDAEAKNLAARRFHEEMETDLRISDFNARLMDMIRQGKEALGTTVEVEGGGDSRGVDPWEDE
ncbi:hypothetical protein GGR54DRAFT_106047 [Hypoxylon sp. NC1633]|nr:hypothetical protein GGR54DRAFT_106047 [Hypoxylon sp. NC1633]